TRDAVPGRIAEVLQEVFGFPLRHVGLVEGEMLVPKETVGEDLSRMPEPKAQPLSEDLVATRAIQAGEAVVVESTGGLENDLDYGTLSTLAGIPIGGHGAVVVGKEAGTFDALDLRLLEVLGGYGTLVLGRLEREERLVQAREEAEEAAQLKSAMLANMSHEVRTPLMSMIGSADLLREDLEEAGLEGEPADMAEQIFRSGQRLRETLDSVLELSRLESGAYTLDDDSAYLDVVVREVAQELNLRAHEKGIQLEVGSPGASVEAGLDETAVRRIVRNLVENAIKFTPEGGKVQVRVEPEDEETALLAVEDTGVGIAEEAREDIFDAFKQESEGLGREYEGSGLGLSIVDRLTTMLGGTIEVESEKGTG
ncbi:sensor histidine kinase, partial [Salinibacter ruber]